MSTVQSVKDFVKKESTAVFDAETTSANSREIAAALNLHLAHAVDLRARTKQAYWNAKGGNYYALHKMFNDFSGDLDSIADDIAARVMALGGVPVWMPPAAGKISGLPPYPNGAVDATQHFEALIASYEAAASTLPVTLDAAAKSGDYATAGILGGYAKILDEQLGIVIAHLPPGWMEKPAGRKAS